MVDQHAHERILLYINPYSSRVFSSILEFFGLDGRNFSIYFPIRSNSTFTLSLIFFWVNPVNKRSIGNDRDPEAIALNTIDRETHPVHGYAALFNEIVP